jgi:hypothetical protein
MLKIVDSKGKYILVDIINEEFIEITKLNPLASQFYKKYDMINVVLKEMDELPGFTHWFKILILNYITKTGDRFNTQILFNNINTLNDYVEKYINNMGLNFDKYYKVEKRSMSSISFTGDDIRKIICGSTCLKLYAIFLWDDILGLNDADHKKFYQQVTEKYFTDDIVEKIFQVIKSRTFKSSVSDRFMWDFIENTISESPDTFIMMVFNFIMKYMIVILDPKMNPIPFIISKVDHSIRWTMHDMYKDKYIFGDLFSEGDNIDKIMTGSTETFYGISCKDTINKCISKGMDIMKMYCGESDKYERILDKMNGVSVLYPHTRLLVFPLLSRIFEIPYDLLCEIPSPKGLILGMFLMDVLDDTIVRRFPMVYDLIRSYPTTDKYFPYNKTSFKIRNPELIVNDDVKLYTFGSKKFKYNFYSQVVGHLYPTKKYLQVFPSETTRFKGAFSEVESDVTMYLSDYISPNFERTVLRMREKAFYRLKCM